MRVRHHVTYSEGWYFWGRPCFCPFIKGLVPTFYYASKFCVYLTHSQLMWGEQ